MAVYNNKYTLRNLLGNVRLKKIFPQFEGHITPDDNDIRDKIMDYISRHIGGRIKGGDIIVKDTTKESVISILNAVTDTVEGLFNNYETITKNLNNDKKIYTTIKSISKLTSLTSKEQAKIMQDIIYSLKYSPDFASNNDKSARFLYNQKRWAKKVGYKGTL